MLFIDGGVTAFNHLGESDLAVACFQKCQSLAHTVPLETYMQTVRRRVVAKLDSYAYDDALTLANYVVEYEEQIQGLRKNSAWMTKRLVWGRPIASWVRCMLIWNEKKLNRICESSFYIPRRNERYYRTLSYLLHYYIDAEKQRDMNMGF